tara:strand:+ start:2054 stop:2989 length:936 start_codon:yes stop_codon:yes gene_type:complete
MERYNLPEAEKKVEAFGLEFPNVVGLAAGMDKDARFWRAAGALGFGHIEVGSVTLCKQEGNPPPRLFRYPEAKSIINRMGFNNDGAEAIVRRLQPKDRVGSRKIPVGINIGKSKVASIEDAVEDYIGAFNILSPLADFVTINVSSPNTPELRKLQGQEYLEGLLRAIRDSARARSANTGQRPIPLLVKIAPDLSRGELECILETILRLELDGIVATNTTVKRVDGMERYTEIGGLSGFPLHKRSIALIKDISRLTSGKLTIIGVGGIFDTDTAAATLDAGATLIQLYTGLIYGGPFLAREIVTGLRAKKDS